MSIYSLAGLDLPFLSILLRQLERLELFKSTDEVMCSICHKIKREQQLILINHHQLALERTDLLLICSRCRLSHLRREGETFVSYRLLMKTINTVLDHQLQKEALPVINAIIDNLRKRKKNNGFHTQSLISELNEKLMGWSHDQGDTCEYQKHPRRTAALIHQFYSEFQRSYPVRYHRTQLISDFKIDNALITLLKTFARREKTFKLSILNHLQYITQTTRDEANLEEWLRKGMQGMNNFQNAFTTLRNRQQTLFSICRRTVQFRSVYDEEEMEGKREFVVTELPMNELPFVFKLSCAGLRDQVEIGLFYAGKNEVNGEYYQASGPLLFKFAVGLGHDKLEPKNAFEPYELRKKRTRLDKNGQSSQNEFEQSQEWRPRKSTDIIQLDDQDQLELHIDYPAETFTIRNKTTNKPLLSSPIKPNSTSKYTIFPCLRLCGPRLTVTCLP